MGHISDILREAKAHYKTSATAEIPALEKLEILCRALQVTPNQFDHLLSDYSPVLRTIRGHAFESFFDLLLETAGYQVQAIGGDDAVDRVVNGHTFQLKTPTMAESKGKIVSYKTHKTHGAKSELESIEYYHAVSEFADFLVGLVLYQPLQILILRREELPTHPLDAQRIVSPFKMNWATHPGLNAFERIGLDRARIENAARLLTYQQDESLPLTAQAVGVTSEIILNAIMREENFRIWDMSIRGFASEVVFKDFLEKANIKFGESKSIARPRADKADLGLWSKDGTLQLFQIKGISVRGCRFRGIESIVDVETQLTRGRINDHPTQSRMYLTTDWDYLLLVIAPELVERYHKEINAPANPEWEFYSIPVSKLVTHPNYPNRLKPHQHFRYVDLQTYRVGTEWLIQWQSKE